MKRVLIVTYYWPPGGGAGVQRWVKLSNYFFQQGVLPYIVTVDPAKASYGLSDPTLAREINPAIHVTHTATREPYNLYKKITGKKEIPFGGFANEEKEKTGAMQKLSRFVRGNLFLPDARVGWNPFAFKTCCEIIRREKIDAIITTSPPHSTQLVGLKLKRKFNLPWLADLRDPWTDIYYYDKLFHSAWAKKRDAKMERSVLESADAVVVVSDDIRRNFSLKSKNIALEKIHVVPNGFDREDFERVQPERKENEFVISYTGTLTDDYRLEGFLGAIGKLKSLNISFRLKITGSMPVSIRGKIENAAKKNCIFRSHVSHHEAIAQMKSADILLLVIPDAKGNKGILTGKLFEYLASGHPVLCVGPVDGDAAAIIRECNAGGTFSYDDADSIFHFIEKNLASWKVSGKTNGGDAEKIKKFSREEQAKMMIRILEGK